MRSVTAAERDDRGSATVFFAITAAGFLVMAGLILDGGARIRGIEHADTLAAEAARTAGQAIDLPALMSGTTNRASSSTTSGTVTIDQTRARNAAMAYLTANAATGTVTVDPATHTIRVTATVHQPTVFLGLIGITDLTAEGQATATLLRTPGTAP
jgi:hypothetical protein